MLLISLMLQAKEFFCYAVFSAKELRHLGHLRWTCRSRQADTYLRGILEVLSIGHCLTGYKKKARPSKRPTVEDKSKYIKYISFTTCFSCSFSHSKISLRRGRAFKKSRFCLTIFFKEGESSASWPGTPEGHVGFPSLRKKKYRLQSIQKILYYKYLLYSTVCRVLSERLRLDFINSCRTAIHCTAHKTRCGAINASQEVLRSLPKASCILPVCFRSTNLRCFCDLILFFPLQSPMPGQAKLPIHRHRLPLLHRFHIHRIDLSN